MIPQFTWETSTAQCHTGDAFARTSAVKALQEDSLVPARRGKIGCDSFGVVFAFFFFDVFCLCFGYFPSSSRISGTPLEKKTQTRNPRDVFGSSRRSNRHSFARARMREEEKHKLNTKGRKSSKLSFLRAALFFLVTAISVRSNSATTFFRYRFDGMVGSVSLSLDLNEPSNFPSPKKKRIASLGANFLPSLPLWHNPRFGSVTTNLSPALAVKKKMSCASKNSPYQTQKTSPRSVGKAGLPQAAGLTLGLEQAENVVLTDCFLSFDNTSATSSRSM